MAVTYLLARTPHHYKLAHDLIRSEGFPEHELNFPTCLAIQDGEVTGVLATDTTQDMIIAGPFILKSGWRPFTIIGLIEFYESVMRVCGITSFVFAVEQSNSKWIDKVERVYELKPYASQDGVNFYIRNL